jgi:hypothetical protein
MQIWFIWNAAYIKAFRRVFPPLIITDVNIFKHYTELLANKDRAMVQAVTGGLLTVKVRDQSQASVHEVYGGQSSAGKGYSPSS